MHSLTPHYIKYRCSVVLLGAVPLALTSCIACKASDGLYNKALLCVTCFDLASGDFYRLDIGMASAFCTVPWLRPILFIATYLTFHVRKGYNYTKY